MPDDSPYSESALRDVGEQLREVRRVLGYPQDAGGRSLASPTLDRDTYMRRIRAQIRVDRAPDREDYGDDPFGNYLADVLHEIEEGADRLRNQAVGGRGGLLTGGSEVVCCVVQGLYEIAKKEDLGDDLQSVRAVAEDDVRKWVRLLRELLVAFRSVLQSSSASARLQLDLSILNMDPSALILEGVYAGIAAILFAVHELMADFARRVDDRVTEALASTNCAPLMRIWAAVYNLIFGAGAGLIGRTRTLLRDVILSQARKRRSKTLSVGVGGEISSERKARRISQINDLIEVLDAILAALSVFTICRIPREEGLQDSSGENSSDEPGDDDSGRDGGGSGNNPTEDDGGADNEDRAVSQVVPSERPNGSLTQTNDPDLGQISVLDPDPESEDLLYFTPTNIAKLLTTQFDISREQALDMAREQDCRNQLSEETESILREVGIINDE
jgi:hypothetical protein